ncbi:hypothetical protein [Clostridium sp. BJN0013]|mgnify:CR=1 FL=1
MNIAVVTYSLTGNNGALAATVAKALSAEHNCMPIFGKNRTGLEGGDW